MDVALGEGDGGGVDGGQEGAEDTGAHVEDSVVVAEAQHQHHGEQAPALLCWGRVIGKLAGKH